MPDRNPLSRVRERGRGEGETRYTSGTTPTDFRYTGQRFESLLGLHDYGARWYDSLLGRWLQPDSIVPLESQGVQAWDRYAYANNNPVRYNDPTGHDVGCAGRDASECRKATPKKTPEKLIPPNGYPRPFVETNPVIGIPGDPGDYLGGVCKGGGFPNMFYVGGSYADDESKSIQLAGAKLDYYAAYDLHYFERATEITLTEEYKLSRPFYGPEAKAGANLNIMTVDNARHTVVLGQFPTDDGFKTTRIYLFGENNRPQYISISIILLLTEAILLTKAFPDYVFTYQP